MPFFDDGWCPSLSSFTVCSIPRCLVDAIIFLAPISGFDQVLAEDRSVNRLVSYLSNHWSCELTVFVQEDSVLLWKAVCSNKLLANVDLVLFLNKCDILDAKLSSGIRLSKYVRSYGDRPNDMETASKCRYLNPFLYSAADLNRRLPKQVQRDTSRILAAPTEILWILHDCHGTTHFRLSVLVEFDSMI